MFVETKESEIIMRPKAVGLKNHGSYGNGTVWLPKSMIILSVVQSNKIKIYVPDWIADRHGLYIAKQKRRG